MIAAFGLGSLTGLPGYGDKGWAIGPFFCLTTIPLSIIYSWLRFRSGSVWPCVLAHAMANGGLATLAILTLSHPGSIFIGGPIGLLGIAPMWAVAVWLVTTHRIRSIADHA